MLYKYINKETIKEAPKCIRKNMEFIDEETGEKTIAEAVISNPSEQDLRELGYTDLIVEKVLLYPDKNYIKEYELINHKIFEKNILIEESDNQ